MAVVSASTCTSAASSTSSTATGDSRSLARALTSPVFRLAPVVLWTIGPAVAEGRGQESGRGRLPVGARHEVQRPAGGQLGEGALVEGQSDPPADDRPAAAAGEARHGGDPADQTFRALTEALRCIAGHRRTLVPQGG